MNAFSIYNFQDPVDALHGYLEIKKQESLEIPVRTWAKEMGFTSPKLLNDILKRRTKIKNKYAEFLIRGLELDRTEDMYFRSMVHVANARDEKERQLYLLLLKELLPEYRGEVVRSEDDDIFSHWIYMTILVLAGVKDFKMSAENISFVLKPGVEVERVQSAIALLEEKGLLRRESDGRLVASQFAVTTKTQVRQSAVRQYYEQVFQLAKEAIDESLENREYQCFSVRLKSEDIPVVNQMIRQLRQRVSSMASDEADVVHQVNLCSFPLTEKF